MQNRPVRSSRRSFLKGLAVTTLKRSALMPELPTIAETLPGFNVGALLGFIAPAGTPKAVIDKYQSEIVKALTDANVKEQFAAQGLTPLGTTPAELAVLLKNQLNRYTKLIREAGITAS